MTAPHHRAHLADRVQRLETWAAAVDGDLASSKAKLPAMIREEILNYTEPVFGEIMAGRGPLATKEHLNALERRLTDLMDTRFQSVDARLDQMDARFEAVDARLDQMETRFEARFESVDAKLDKVLAALGKMDG